MRIMIGIGHPKQVHIWKNIAKNLIEGGHEIKILSTNKDVAADLLNVYGFDYETYGRRTDSLAKKAYSMVGYTLHALSVAKNFKPDILIAGSPYLAYVSKILRKPHIMITDTEHANLVYWLTYPVTDVIITPSCFKGKINPKKHVMFDGYFELAYLHPNYFTPDPSVLKDLGLSDDAKFIIRLISWGASHDAHSKGVSLDFLEHAIKLFEEYGRVFITSERKLDKNLEKYKLNIAPEKLHSALYYADFHFGEGGATAMESALLGTPTVHFEAFKSRSGELVDATHIHGIFDALVNRYKVLHTFADENKALDKSLEILQDKNSKKESINKRNQILKEKIDVTAFMTNFIENYPESFHEYRNSRER